MARGLDFPQILRIFSRTILVLFVVAAFLIIFLNVKTRPVPIVYDQENVLKLRPEMTNLRFSYVFRLLEDGQITKAKAQLKNAYQFDKKNVYVNSMLLGTIVNGSELKSELAKTKGVVEKRPDWAAAWIKLAGLYEMAGKAELAREAQLKAESLKTI